MKVVKSNPCDRCEGVGTLPAYVTDDPRTAVERVMAVFTRATTFPPQGEHAATRADVEAAILAELTAEYERGRREALQQDAAKRTERDEYLARLKALVGHRWKDESHE
jgi:hypothetical protein